MDSALSTFHFDKQPENLCMNSTFKCWSMDLKVSHTFYYTQQDSNASSDLP